MFLVSVPRVVFMFHCLSPFLSICLLLCERERECIISPVNADSCTVRDACVMSYMYVHGVGIPWLLFALSLSLSLSLSLFLSSYFLLHVQASLSIVTPHAHCALSHAARITSSHHHIITHFTHLHAYTYVTIII